MEAHRTQRARERYRLPWWTARLAALPQRPVLHIYVTLEEEFGDASDLNADLTDSAISRTAALAFARA
jgi:hypothetical protein